MQLMTPEETRAFLLQEPRTGKLATVEQMEGPTSSRLGLFWMEMI